MILLMFAVASLGADRKVPEPPKPIPQVEWCRRFVLLAAFESELDAVQLRLKVIDITLSDPNIGTDDRATMERLRLASVRQLSSLNATIQLGRLDLAHVMKRNDGEIFVMNASQCILYLQSRQDLNQTKDY